MLPEKITPCASEGSELLSYPEIPSNAAKDFAKAGFEVDIDSDEEDDLESEVHYEFFHILINVRTMKKNAKNVKVLDWKT